MDFIEALDRQTKRFSDRLILRQYIVASVQVGTITVQDYDLVTEVRYLDTYSPSVGDTVWAIVNGPDIIVLGKLAS